MQFEFSRQGGIFLGKGLPFYLFAAPLTVMDNNKLTNSGISHPFL